MNVIYLFITGEKRINLSDDLKSINKEYGPLEGDKVLVATAFALKALAAEYDFYIARFDADEFVNALFHQEK